MGQIWDLKIQQPLWALADLNEHFSGVFTEIKKYSQQVWDKPQLLIYPELTLGGYPLKDLTLHPDFIDCYQNQLAQFNQNLQNLPYNPYVKAIVGGIDYERNDQLPYNVAFLCEGGKKSEVIHKKILLPNYDIFDEKKYFAPGKSVRPIELWGQKVGILICEDIWCTTSNREGGINPIQMLHSELIPEKVSLSMLIALNASPFDFTKDEVRKLRAKNLGKLFACPIIYANRVAAEDELIFDGGSFCINPPHEIAVQAKRFSQDQLSYSLEVEKKNTVSLSEGVDLYCHLSSEKNSLRTLSHDQLDSILQALILGIQEYAKRSKLQSWLVALSGGIDSALVLTLAKIASLSFPGSSVEAIYMPGFYSQELSFKLAQKLSHILSVPFSTLPIKFLHSTSKNALRDHLGIELKNLADENIQSRLRGMLLYAVANSKNSLVLNTSNKSELAVGYSTLYGDSVGALSVIGDLYKTYVYQLCQYINETKPHQFYIPQDMIKRPPSAELKENQKDSDSLPHYDELDLILTALIDKQMSKTEILKIFPLISPEILHKVYQLYFQSEFKRQQFPPILKVFPKSFGFGHRIPIGKSYYTKA